MSRQERRLIAVVALVLLAALLIVGGILNLAATIHTSQQQLIDMMESDKRTRRYLKVTKKGAIELDRAAIAEAQKHDGKWVIQTNDDTLSVEDAACAYKALLVIERCFRMLKRTRLKMEPLQHWLAYSYNRLSEPPVSRVSRAVSPIGTTVPLVVGTEDNFRCT